MMATPEFQVRKTEIIKLQNVDIVINRRQTEIDDLELQQLADKIVLEHRSDPTQDVFSNWYMTTTGTDKIGFLDSETNPKYFAKKKWINVNLPGFSQSLKIVRGEVGSKNDSLKTDWQLTDSILSEMSLSKEINSLVQSEEAQNIFTTFGIKKLLFVQPLIGIIDRKQTNKYVVYKHIKAQPWIALPGSKGTFQANDLAKKLKKYFYDNGYEARDLDERQFLLDKTTDQLYLIDTEGYFRKRVV